MLATPAISSTPIHAARLHARPPSGAEPQTAAEAGRAERASREDLRQRLRRGPQGPEAAERSAPADRAQIAALAARDRAVRAHEQAHARVAGQYAGMPRYEFVTGPDGRRYAVDGAVPIDVSPEPSDPAATIEKMRVIKAAALAPADPSPADRRVAALAERMMRAAEADLREMEADARAAEATSREIRRLARISALFAQTVVLPAPDPLVVRIA